MALDLSIQDLYSFGMHLGVCMILTVCFKNLNVHLYLFRLNSYELWIMFGSNTVGYISVELDLLSTVNDRKSSQTKINLEELHLPLPPPHHQLFQQNLLSWHPLLALDVVPSKHWANWVENLLRHDLLLIFLFGSISSRRPSFWFHDHQSEVYLHKQDIGHNHLAYNLRILHIVEILQPWMIHHRCQNGVVELCLRDYFALAFAV